MTDAPWANWRRRWEDAAAACVSLGGEAREFVIEPPATEYEVRVIERSLGAPIPSALRRVLIGFSRKVDVGWSLPEGLKRPAGLEQIFAGECVWGLDDLPRVEESRRGWLRECFSNPENPYDRVWHDKFALAPVPNGDVVAIDPRATGEPVVYLSHDDGEGHGKMMGRDFISFVHEHSMVGCMGLEDWQWVPFHRVGVGIDGGGEPAQAFRAWLGLRAP